MKVYFKENQKTLFGVFVLALLIGGIRTVTSPLGIDSELFYVRNEELLASWVGLGRWSLAVLSVIFKNWTLYALNAAIYLFVYIYTVLFLYFLKSTGGSGNNFFRDIVSASFLIASPVFMEQYYFTMQGPQVGIGLILWGIAIISTYHFLESKRWMYAFSAVLCLIVCFGIYQSFYELYILGALICLYRMPDRKKNLQNIGQCILIFVCAATVSFGIGIAMKNALHIPSSQYLQVGWLTTPFPVMVKQIVESCIRIALNWKYIWNVPYAFVALFFLEEMFTKDKGWKAFYRLCILFCPFMLIIVAGLSVIVPRAAWCFPFLFMFASWEFLSKERSILQTGSAAAVRIFVVLIAVMLFADTMYLEFVDYSRYKVDVKTVDTIYRECNADKDTVLAFVGCKAPKKGILLCRQDLYGSSFFAWDIVGGNTSGRRIWAFMECIGFPYTEPNEEQQQAAEMIPFETSYPNEGYVVEQDGVYYINLGK